MIISIQSTRYAMEPMRVLAFGAIPNNYNVATGAGALIVPVGAPNQAGRAALLYPARQWILSNDTDQTIYYSLNGIDDHGKLVAGRAFVNDMTSNKTGTQAGSKAWSLSAGDIVYVRFPGVLGTAGEVTLSLAYGGE